MDEKPPAHQPASSWWQTLPGILTALAGLITAVAGLLLALHQIGVFAQRLDRDQQAERTPQLTAVAQATLVMRAAKTVMPDHQRLDSPLVLPARNKVTLGTATYDILAAHVEEQNMENLSLQFSIRMTNNGDYPDNFWNESFRLLVDDVPRAPTGDLNKVVDGHSAEEGEVVFTLPKTATTVVLRVSNGTERTDIAINIIWKQHSHSLIIKAAGLDPQQLAMYMQRWR